MYYPHSKQREKTPDGLKETILPLEGELEGVGQLIQSISYIITKKNSLILKFVINIGSVAKY